MTKYKYEQIAESKVPEGVRFDVPGHLQGQIVEVAYADWPKSRYEAGAGARYQRVHDRSDRSTTYYELA